MSRFFQSRRFAVALLCIALLPCDSAAQMPSAATARVVTATGRVSLESGRDLWALQPNDVVQPGQVIVSGPDGYAVLLIEDGSRIEVFASSRVIFRANRGNWRDVLDVFLGKVKISIQKLGGRPNPYRVNSATALIAVRGTTFEVAVERDDTTTISVHEGVVAVSHKLQPGGKEVLLSGGDVLVVRPGEPLTQAGVAKARLAARILIVAIDNAMRMGRLGGRGGPMPVPGGGTSGPGGDLGQAPPPPPDVPDEGGAGPPPPGGSGPPPPP